MRSLAYLRHLPADELKLDRSLTADVDRDHRAAAIVEHTVALAHALGLRPGRRGRRGRRRPVPRSAALGCDVAQGYAIARPMPVADFLTWLEAPPVFLLDGSPDGSSCDGAVPLTLRSAPATISGPECPESGR